MIAEYIRDLCRICVERSEDYIHIYDKVVPDNTPFYCIINDVCQLDISENDGFPEYICKDCFLKISEFMMFKRKSHDAKLNFLSMNVSLSEPTNSKEVSLNKEAVVATNIIVKEMTSEGMTLDVAQPCDIIEEIITVPYIVDYEEVVTDDTYTLSEDQTYAAVAESVSSPSPSLPTPLVDRKRNSKEREVAIILADGGRAMLPKEKGSEVTVTEDTGQEGREKVICEDDEESGASQRRSFVAQAYYRSYLLEKERREEEKASEAIATDSTSMVLDAEEGNGGEVMEVEMQDKESCIASPSEEVDPPEEEAAPIQETLVVMEEPPSVEEVNRDKRSDEVGSGHSTSVQAVAESVSSEEGIPKAVCCKKKMLAISKSLALSRSLELSEKVMKPEAVVVGSDLDVLVEACRSREESWNSNVNIAPVESTEVPVVADDHPSKTEVVMDAVLLDGDGDEHCNGRTDHKNNHDIIEIGVKGNSGKAALKVVAKEDRRGNAQGPRFRLSGSKPALPPKRRKKQSPKQGMKVIQVIASEELRAKRQQLDLEQVGDILKTSLSGKKTIQVSEVGPSGKVFHVEPTIVKLRGMPMTVGRHMTRSQSIPSAEFTKTGPANVPKKQGEDEGESGGGDRGTVVCGISLGVDSKGSEDNRGEKQVKERTIVNNEDVMPPGPLVAEGTNPIDILGSDDGTPKTLLLTAPKERNSSTPALAIFLRPMKQEEVDNPMLEIGDHEASTKSLQLLTDSLNMREELTETEVSQQAGEAPSEDSEAFCNRIRLRARKAMLGCIKKTLDELERMQGQDRGQEDLVFASEGGEGEQQVEELENEEVVYTCVHCGQSSYSKAEMGWHMKVAHNSGKQSSEYYCTKCDRCFTKHYVYRLHMQLHDLPQEVEEESIKEKAMTPEESLSSFKCQYCDLQFSGKSSLLFHEASKHQTSPLFSCALCSKKFLTEEKREAHQSLCNGNRLECELCHKEYNVGSITQHMRTHRGEKPYLCAECGKTFSQKGDLKRHTKQIHLGMEPAKPFLCSFCPKTFSAQSKLRIHERSHTKEKPFVCDECGKGFAHLSTLRKHRENREFACLPIIKQAAKQYTCTICKKGWDQKYALTKHIAWVHERKRPSRTFPCPYCSKVYYCRSQLTYHERTHTKEKPFACSICNKRFMYNSVRKAHMAKEHGLKRSISDGPR